MSQITMDPPHLVHTGVGCTSCCAVAPGKLLRCSACDSAWYCNQECQRKNFKEHKPFCRALRLFHALQADLPPESWPKTGREFYVQRINCQQLLEPMLRRPLSRLEQRAILGEAKCSVCMRTRAQLAKGPQTHGSAAPAAADVGAMASAELARAATTAAVQLSSRSGDGSGCGGGSGRGGGGAGDGASSTVPVGDATATAPTIPGPGAEPRATTSAACLPSERSAAQPAPAAQPAAAQSGEGAAGSGSTPAEGGAAAGLSCCPHCHWGWACAAHREAYLSGPHAAVCLQYQHMNESQLMTHRYLAATGRLPNYVPDTLRRPTGQPHPPQQPASGAAPQRQGQGQQQTVAEAAVAAWEPVPAGWAAYQGWRPLPAFDSGTLCLLSKRMSQALTVVQALQHHYTPPQLAALRHLEVHVLGASGFEVPADRIWEEILNLLPPSTPSCLSPAAAGSPSPSVGTATAAAPTTAMETAPVAAAGPRVLHVAFVGPELRDIIVEDSDGLSLPQGTSLAAPPPPPGRELLYSYHLAPYQEWAAGRRPRGGGAAASGAREAVWRRPDIAIAFNSGVSESEQKLWAPALELLVRHAVPVVFTSYNADEAAADAAAWRAAGGAVTLGPERNPFRVLEPIAEPSEVDKFYYQNYYWWCGVGKAEAADSGSSA